MRCAIPSTDRYSALARPTALGNVCHVTSSKTSESPGSCPYLPNAAEGMHSENQGKHAQGATFPFPEHPTHFNPLPGPLKVVTYNVWFDPRNQAARADAVWFSLITLRLCYAMSGTDIR
eukprot:2642472-Rhodomonas_salina.3